MELGSAELAQRLVDLVRADDGLPGFVRSQAEGLRELVDNQPDLALTRLDEIASSYAEDAQYRNPTVQLAKAVTVEAFWEHYLDDEVKAMFADPESYRRYLVTAEKPQDRAMDDIKSKGVLIPAPYSWLAPYRDIASMSGLELIDALELAAERRPPMLLLVLRDEDLREFGVVVRTPRATDAAAARQTQWRSSGLASGIDEFIDRDIAPEAVREVAWRP